MTSRRTHLDAAAAALMVTLCAIWGLNQVAAKVTNSGISPILQAGLRSAGAALLVWAWSAYCRVPLFTRDRSLGPGIVVGLLFGAEFAVMFWGLEYTTANRGVILLYTAPFWVALGAHLFIPGERLRPQQVIGLMAAFAGVVLAFSDGLTMPTWQQLVGDVMLLLAGLLWAATTVVIKSSRLATVSHNKMLFYQLAVSGLCLPLASILLGEPGIFAPTTLVVSSLTFQTVIVAFASYLAWFWLVAHYPAGRLSAFTFLTPLFGLAAGTGLLGEPISLALVAAMVLVGAGIWLVNRPPAAPAKQVV